MKKKFKYYSILFETWLSLLLLDIGEYMATRFYDRSVSYKVLRVASKRAYSELKRVLNLTSNSNG